MIAVITPAGIAYFSDEDYDIAYDSWYPSAKGYLQIMVGRKPTYAHKIVAARIDLIGRIDHEDRNKLNNRRGNLRLANVSKNAANSNLSKANKSGYKGVAVFGNAFTAQITVNCKKLHLGVFSDPKDAALAYDAAAIQHFGKFANINFPRMGD